MRFATILVAALLASAAFAGKTSGAQRHPLAGVEKPRDVIAQHEAFLSKLPVQYGIDGPNTDCASSPPQATLTWVKSCSNITARDPACWTPNRLPTTTDVLYFPAGANAILYASTTLTYELVNVDSVIVESGATLQLQGDAIQVSSCFIVRGALTLSTGIQGNPHDPTLFLADPAQPEGTDCSVVPAGFTPRICGPGRLIVAKGGSATTTGEYASFFLSGLVQQGGSMSINAAGFFWGNMTISGSFQVAEGSYAHGFLNIFPTGTLTLNGYVWYDKWATSYLPTTAPLLINNQGGNVIFAGNQFNTIASYGGTYRSLLVNRGTATFLGGWYAGVEFDIFNFGTLSWSMYGTQFQGIGTTLNKGLLVANGSSVYLSSMHSYGGTLKTINGGSFSFGNGASNPKSLKFCQLFGDNAIYRKHIEDMTVRKQAIDKYVDSVHNGQVQRLVDNNVRYEKVGDRECWWYFSICYSMPYLSSAPDTHLDERLPVKVAAKRFKRTPLTRVYSEVTRLVIEANEDFEMEAACHVRYVFSRTKIEGDASSGASVVTTMPVEINDYLLIANGGRWFPIMDRRTAPFRGTGQIVVGKEGIVVASVEADFKSGGRVLVQRGGSFVVPKHSKVHFTNESLFVARGGVLHVDGQLALHSEPTKGFHDFVNCGLLYGTGKVQKERASDLACSDKEVAAHRVKKSAWRNTDVHLRHDAKKRA